MKTQQNKTPVTKNTRPVTIVRRDLDGSQIIRTACSLGYQVWLRGTFVSYQSDVESANSLLNKIQDRP